MKSRGDFDSWEEYDAYITEQDERFAEIWIYICILIIIAVIAWG